MTRLPLSRFLTAYKELHGDGKYETAAVGRYGIRKRSEIYSKELAKDYSKNHLIRKDTLTIGMGSRQIDIGILFTDDVYSVSPAYRTFKIRGINSAYLRYCLDYCNDDMSKRFMIASCRQGKAVDVKALLDYQIPIRGNPEQLQVVCELDRLCALKKNAEDRLAILDKLVKSWFVEMFGDLQTNSKCWNVASFEDAATIDGTLEKDFKRYADYPHIGIDSIVKGSGELVGYRTVLQDGVVSGKYHFTPKHIIYSKIRPNLNKVALPDFEGLCSADAYAILPKDNADRVYLAYVLRSKFFLDYIIPLSGRTGMPKANRKQIQGFEFPLPPLALQREFAAFVAEVDKSKAALRETVATLDQLYRAKLQENFG